MKIHVQDPSGHRFRVKKPKTAELLVVRGDVLSSAPARWAAPCRAFLGIAGDGDSKPLCHSSGKKINTSKTSRKTRPTEYRNYPCFSAPGPGPPARDVQDETKSPYTESFLPQYHVSSLKATTLFAQLRNSPICQSKEPHSSIPQLQSYTHKQAQHRFGPPAPLGLFWFGRSSTQKDLCAGAQDCSAPG